MIVLIVVLFAAAMFACERLRPARSFPRIPGWYARTALLNLFQVLVTYELGTAHDRWLLRHRPWSADSLGLVGASLVGYVAITLVYYFWHRARHESRVLWRMLHQVHHSPERIEVLTSFYKHPLEILLNSLLSSAVLYLGVGVGPEAASIAVLLTALAELLYHWNVSTPRWIGWIVQRPESHCLHHELGVHARNYADLPLWDGLFGTLENPPRFDGRCGYGEGRERKLLPMLAFADANATREEAPAS